MRINPLGRTLLVLAMLPLPALALTTSQNFDLVKGSVNSEETLSPNERSSLQRGLADTAVTQTAFDDAADETAWLEDMSRRLARHIPDEDERFEFLTTLHWEATRAGIDPQLMLALIQVKSGFNKYFVSPDGARGYMQVMPFWIRVIGNPDHNLFQLRTNLRYGALILRHYIDVEKGDMYRALGRYEDNRGRSDFPQLVIGTRKKAWDYSTAKRVDER